MDGEKIKFPGGGTHFHDGADKYIAAIAGVRWIAFYLKLSFMWFTVRLFIYTYLFYFIDA